MLNYPLPAGTVTEFGTVEGLTYTAYKMTDGSFVPFTKLHPPKFVEPLITFG